MRHRKGILGGTHATFNTVLNRDHGVVAATGEDIIESFADVVNTDPFVFVGTGNLPHGLPGEGSHGAQIAIALGSRSHAMSLVSTAIAARAESGRLKSAGEEPP